MTDVDRLDVARWTIHPARRIHHDEGGTSLALGRVDPRPELDSEPFGVVRASDYEGVVEERDALRDIIARASRLAEEEQAEMVQQVLREARGQ
jgi:hypothetical protein